MRCFAIWKKEKHPVCILHVFGWVRLPLKLCWQIIATFFMPTRSQYWAHSTVQQVRDKLDHKTCMVLQTCSVWNSMQVFLPNVKKKKKIRRDLCLVIYCQEPLTYQLYFYYISYELNALTEMLDWAKQTWCFLREIERNTLIYQSPQ